MTKLEVVELPSAGKAKAHDRTDAAATTHSGVSTRASPALRTPFLPLLAVALALVGQFSVQLYDAYLQRQTLQAAHASQQQTVDNAGKLRQSLDALAADTQRMANGGNANAALLVTELRQRGITIHVPSASTSTEAASKPKP